MSCELRWHRHLGQVEALTSEAQYGADPYPACEETWAALACS